MEHEILTSQDEIEGIEREWEILRKCCDASIYASHAWALEWLDKFGSHTQPNVVVLKENGRTCAIAPFIITEQKTAGIKIKKLSMIGNGTGTTELYDLSILWCGEAEKIADALAEIIDQLDWNVIQIHDIREDDVSTLLYEKISSLWDTDEIVKIPCPYVELDSISDALDNASSRTRRMIRKTLQPLEEDSRIRYRRVDIPEEVKEAAEFYALHHISRWEDKGGSIFSNEDIASFLKDITTYAANEGYGEVFEVWIDGTLASQMICFEDGDVMRAYRVGMQPRFSQLSPGNLVSYYAMSEALKSGFTRFDFGAGSEEYKYRLGSKDRFLMRIQSKRGSMKTMSKLSSLPGVKYVLNKSGVKENALKAIND